MTTIGWALASSSNYYMSMLSFKALAAPFWRLLIPNGNVRFYFLRSGPDGGDRYFLRSGLGGGRCHYHRSTHNIVTQLLPLCCYLTICQTPLLGWGAWTGRSSSVLLGKHKSMPGLLVH